MIFFFFRCGNSHLASLPPIDRQTAHLPTPSKSVKDVGVAGTLAAPDPFDALNIDVCFLIYRSIDDRYNMTNFFIYFCFVSSVGRTAASIVGRRTQRARGEQRRAHCSILTQQ